MWSGGSVGLSMSDGCIDLERRAFITERQSPLLQPPPAVLIRLAVLMNK